MVRATKIAVTVVTIMALALGMFAQAITAFADTGNSAPWHAHYYTENVEYKDAAPAQSFQFVTGWTNGGANSWVKGSANEARLETGWSFGDAANPLGNTNDYNAGWAKNWSSSTIIASQDDSIILPGRVGYFIWEGQVPAAAPLGQKKIKAQPMIAGVGALENYGYYQGFNVTTSTSGVTLTSLTPNSGTNAGGTTVVAAGSGFQCTPAFPTVSFGGNAATVVSCGATSLTVTSPAGAVGAVTVTVINNTGATSNGLTYTYTDTTKPTYTGLAVAGNVATVSFSEPVCETATTTGDWVFRNVSAAAVIAVTGDFIPACNATNTNGVTSATLLLASSIPPGAFVEGTLNVGTRIVDQYSNVTNAPQARTTTATAPETTPPTLASVTAVQGASSLTLNFSEPTWCGAGAPGPAAGDITFTPSSGTVLTNGTNNCPTTAGTGLASWDLSLSGALQAGMSYTLSYPAANFTANEVQDVVGNDLATPLTFTFTTGPADFTPPTISDARLTANPGSTTFQEVGDQFTATFSEKMRALTGTETIQLTDTDGTVVTFSCATSATCAFDTTDNLVLRVTATAVAPTTNVAGSIPGLQIPMTITTLTGFADASAQANTPNLPGSADRVVDYE